MRQRAPRADWTLRAATFVAVTCATLACASRASATPTLDPAPSAARQRGATARVADVDRRAADSMMKDGLAFEREGHLKQATDRLERAVKLHDAIVSRLHLARTLEEQGKLVGALESYHAAFAIPPITTEERDAVASARVRAEELESDVPRVSFVGSLPDAAKVTLDGETVLDARGRTLQVDPGEHVVVVDARGRALWRTKFRVTRGDAREIGVQAGPDVGLRPDLLPPSALVADDKPSADVGLRARSLKPAPTESGALVADRRLHLSRGFYLPDVHTVTQPSTMDLVIPAPPSSDRPPSHGRVVLRDCSLVPCTDEAQAAPQGVPGERKEERVDKRIWSSLTGTGVNVLATQGFLLLTAPAPVPNARVGASMMPNGSSYIALTGLW